MIWKFCKTVGTEFRFSENRSRLCPATVAKLSETLVNIVGISVTKLNETSVNSVGISRRKKKYIYSPFRSLWKSHARYLRYFTTSLRTTSFSQKPFSSVAHHREKCPLPIPPSRPQQRVGSLYILPRFVCFVIAQYFTKKWICEHSSIKFLGLGDNPSFHFPLLSTPCFPFFR